FAGLAVADQPIVGVPAVISFFNNLDVIVDAVRVLQSLAGAHELRLAIWIPSFKLRDGSLRDHHSSGIDSEVVVTDNHSRESIHQDAVTVFRLNIEDDDPAFAGQVTGPVIVGNDDLMILCHGAGCNEGTAIPGSFQPVIPGRFVLLGQPWKVVIRYFLESVECNNVPNIEVDAV